MSAYLAQVLPLWQAEIDDPALEYRQRYKAWYQEADDAFKQTFGELLATLLAEPSGARDIPNTVATVIVLDQFCRKIHGKQADAYSGHSKAAAIAGPLLQSPQTNTLPLIQKIALAMSLSSVEDISLHDQCLQWFAQELDHQQGDDRDTLAGFMAIAEKRREYIRQFGRFPIRNQALGRASTPTEAYFLVGTGWDYE